MSRANEQAFPVPAVAGLPNDNVVWGSAGLTIREHFAALAMASLASHHTQGGNTFAILTAAQAVEYADALIAQLAKVTP